jgi:transposase
MRKSPKFSPEVVERAVRMVFEAKDQYPSQWAAIESIAGKIGCTAETLRRWVRQAERDQGLREGATTAEQQRVKELEREVRELRRANEILKLASAVVAPAGSTAASNRERVRRTVPPALRGRADLQGVAGRPGGGTQAAGSTV